MKTYFILTCSIFINSFNSLAQATDNISQIPQPNFDENLSTFYLEASIILFLLFTINVLAVSIKNFIGSKNFSQFPIEVRTEKIGKLLSVFNKGITLFILFGIGIYSTISLKLNFTLPGNTEKTPWLQVYSVDIYFFLSIIILLTALLIFMVYVLNNLFSLRHQLQTSKEA
jgi:hypothetical protein